MKILILIAVFVMSYIVGSLNSAIICTYILKHKDIRNYGSFNAGLTNVYRCFGPFAAAATMVMDLMKGVIVVFGTRAVYSLDIFADCTLDALSVCMISSLFAVTGHCFPVFYKFRGGKGILLAAMCMLLTDPVVFALEAVTFVITVAATKYISIGSLSACVGYIVYTLLWQNLSNAYFGGSYENIGIHVLIIIPMFIICVGRHFSNIKHLISGEEKKFYFHKKGEEE